MALEDGTSSGDRSALTVGEGLTATEGSTPADSLPTICDGVISGDDNVPS